MRNITITDLFTYPLKSGKGINLDGCNVTESGFEFDRNFAIINKNNKIITAREHAKLLHISTSIVDKTITLQYDEEIFHIHSDDFEPNAVDIILFKKNTSGKLLLNHSVNNWLTQILKEDCKLIKIDLNNQRKAKDTDIAFSDAFPVHLVTTASIKDLNDSLETPITDNRFRPNIIVSGTKPYEEENWKNITIGNCEFEVIQPTERCSLITINPFSLDKDKQQEPLRTLARNKRGHKKVNFGIYLIPKNNGEIKKSDFIIIKG